MHHLRTQVETTLIKLVAGDGCSPTAFPSPPPHWRDGAGLLVRWPCSTRYCGVARSLCLIRLPSCGSLKRSSRASNAQRIIATLDCLYGTWQMSQRDFRAFSALSLRRDLASSHWLGFGSNHTRSSDSYSRNVRN